MEHVTAGELARAVGGSLLAGDPDQLIEHISIDSRTMKGNDLFVPLIGERVDAHRFIGQAFEAGAKAVLTSEHQPAEQEGKKRIVRVTGQEPQEFDAENGLVWILVSDTKAALQAIGAWYRDRLTLPLIGVTGSVGKTTTREMIAAALSAGYRTYKTPGNSNSQVGVPITISEISAEDEIGVIELGMSEPGEMHRIAMVAKVDQAVMTNIGIAHIEQLGSQENICREKLHIQDGMKEGGCLYVNGDDPILRTVKAKEGCRTVSYGTAPDCDYRAVEIGVKEGHPVFTACCRATGEQTQVKLQVFGRHMILNAMVALAVARENGIPMEAAAKALEEFRGFQGRQQIQTVRGITVIDDSYNASPVSMKAGIQVLCDLPAAGKRVAVLADMKELGPDTAVYHREIGSFLCGKGIDQVLLFGELAAEIGKQLEREEQKSGRQTDVQQEGTKTETRTQVRYYTDRETLERDLKSGLQSGDCVLFKGSNSMGLGAAAAALKEG